MVRFTDDAVRFIQQKPRTVQSISWYVRICWDNGDTNNVRTSDGGTEWIRGNARGWFAEVVPYPVADRDSLKLDFESGIPYRVEYTHGHTFPGGVIHVSGNGLALEL